QRLPALKTALMRPGLTPLRVAILGGSTTQQIRSVLELFLLADGFEPSFYESGYDAYYDDAVFAPPSLIEFRPEVVFIHTTWHNVATFPEPMSPLQRVQALADAEL